MATTTTKCGATYTGVIATRNHQDWTAACTLPAGHEGSHWSEVGDVQATTADERTTREE